MKKCFTNWRKEYDTFSQLNKESKKCEIYHRVLSNWNSSISCHLCRFIKRLLSFFFIYVYKNILESIVTKLRYALLLTVQFIIFSCACFSIEKYIILYSLINVAPIIGNSRIAISTWSPDRTVVLRLVTSYVPQNNHVQSSLIYFPL